jgi:hypothetical protein
MTVELTFVIGEMKGHEESNIDFGWRMVKK